MPPRALTSGSDSMKRRGFELPALFALLYSGKARVAGDFDAVIPKKKAREVFSDAIHRHSRGEKQRISNCLPRAKYPKGTGGSNPLCSTNEALRTVRAGSWHPRIFDAVAAYPRGAYVRSLHHRAPRIEAAAVDVGQV